VGKTKGSALATTAPAPQQPTSHGPISQANGDQADQKAKTDANKQNHRAFRLAPIATTLQAREHAAFTAQVDACILAVAVREGQQVGGDEVLLRQDCRASEVELDSALLLQRQAETALAAHEWLLVLGALSHLETVMARVAHNKAQAGVELAESALRKCSVKSPFAGRVRKLAVRAQQCVRAGQPLFELVGDSWLELAFKLPVSQMEQALPGTLASVRINRTGKTYPVRILRHGARTDPLGHTLQVFAVIDGNFPALTAGMSGRLQLAGARRAPVARFVSQQGAR
jgi:multidrug efflux pump subunit AcrA (membrane-fusion protein)